MSASSRVPSSSCWLSCTATAIRAATATRATALSSCPARLNSAIEARTALATATNAHVMGTVETRRLGWTCAAGFAGTQAAVATSSAAEGHIRSIGPPST